MPDYGVTDNGFELKRLDTIMEEVHQDLTDGFGFDTRLQETSFLNVLVTTFCGQIAELWETAQDSYYAKYPSTATGLNLDHAVQYGGITRIPKRRSYYTLHCTGDDGTIVRQGASVATNTSPQRKLYAVNEFEITRNSFNRASVRIAALAVGEIYSVSVNGVQFSYTSTDKDEMNIIKGLQAVVKPDGYKVSVNEDESVLVIEAEAVSRKGVLVLSENLTTASVTVLADFATEDYGKLIFPNGTVTVMVTNISGFNEVENLVVPTYGREKETDVELRQSYINKSASRSSRMIDSICSNLLNNIAEVESVAGYENDTDNTDLYGRPPHSVEIVVDGGDEKEIAAAILDKKAAGIQTFGEITVNVATEYGDSIPVRFNRPEYVYVWMKVVLNADSAYLPANFANLTIDAILEKAEKLKSGENMLSQTFNDDIYSVVGGVTYIDIKCATTTDKDYVPESEEYTKVNVPVTNRQKVVVTETRIEVTYSGNY